VNRRRSTAGGYYETPDVFLWINRHSIRPFSSDRFQGAELRRLGTSDQFPITVKKGHARVKIYEVKNRDGVNWCVSYISPTGRQRRNFANLETAKREAVNIAETLRDGDIEALKLTGRESKFKLNPSERLPRLASRCTQLLMSSPERSTS
jgi:hypothetical protein